MDEQKPKQGLLQSYAGNPDNPCSKRQNRAGEAIFIADDRTKTDLSPYGSPLGSLCEILVRVNDEKSVDVSLRNNVPMSEGVRSWIRDRGASLTTVGGMALELSIVPGKEGLLDELASRIEEITKPGAPRYPVPSYKYAGPRTAASLHRLAHELRENWGSGEPEPH
jgi:hypothetical protein